MSVDSYLELYSTMFGWMFYGVVWDVLVATGIVYLPFLGILIDHWREPAAESPHRVSSGLSLRKIEQEMLIALIVVVFAGQPVPLTPLVSTELSYTPPPTASNPNPTRVDYGSAESTFGTAGFDGAVDTVNVPMWWYAVMAFTSGFNHAVVEGLPRSSEIRHFAQLARLATMEDPRLRQEVADFYTSCYVPARSKFLGEQPSSSLIDSIMQSYGSGDTDWIGSQVYRRTPGYYDTLRSKKPVKGWSFDASRDTEYDPIHPPAHGRPYCKDWWGASVSGLRQKLVDAADVTAPGFATLFYRLAPALATEKRLDLVARTTLFHTPDTWTNNEISGGTTRTGGVAGAIEKKLKSLAYTLGSIPTFAVFGVVVSGIISVAPMFQAMILMGIYALMPLVVVFSRYSLTILVVGALAIFSVKFWTVLWYLAQWVDQNLVSAMYPDVDLLFEFLTNSSEHTTKRMFLDFTTTCLYIGLPILWSAMMAWAGVRIGHSLDSSTGVYTRHTDDAGRNFGSWLMKKR